MPDSILNLKRYLGDGAYANFDGNHVILTTENGVEEYNKIFLDHEVLIVFEAYIKELRERKIIPAR